MTDQIERAGTGGQDAAGSVPDTPAGSGPAGSERVVFFTDAVSAIALTLLALDLPVPGTGPGAPLTNGALWQFLSDSRSAYLPFVISFVVIGAHWRAHHRLFRAAARLDRRVISVNMFWLLMIVLTPYAARLLSYSPPGARNFGVRFSLYAVIQVLTLLALLVMSVLLRRGGLLRPGAAAPLSRFDQRAVLLTAVMFAVSIPVSFASQWAYLCWVACGVIIRWVRRAGAWKARPGSAR